MSTARETQLAPAPVIDELQPEATGVRRRPRAHPRSGPRPLGCELLVVQSGKATRHLQLGPRPGARLAILVGLWFVGLVLAGAALRLSTLNGPKPLRWQEMRARAERIAAALPLTGWARAPEVTRPVEPDARAEAGQRASRLGLGRRPVAGDLLRGKVDPRFIAEAEALGQTPTTFRWPVTSGWFVRGFGSGEDGYHLAVDVAGDEGRPVLAAADGIVAYADDGVRGYGNLLLLVHGDGFVTMYAHNQRHLVTPGEFVRTGQPIALLGNTGISRGPHVHFELMHDRVNCDPVPLFSPGIRHRQGAGFSAGPAARWEGHKPSSVHCAPRRSHPHSRWAKHP